ncbi:MAG TPA: hypothetical protein PKY82_34650 [Pyrinomonadaceae bacterium]|nr:hypothetical protein [Pyrinomonadaceae bacterium]
MLRPDQTQIKDGYYHQAGAALAVVVIGLVVVLIFTIFFLTAFNAANPQQSDDVSAGIGDAGYLTQSVTTDCLFYNKNPRVRGELSRDPNFIKSLVYYSKGLGYHQNDMISVFRIECDFNWHVVNPFGCGGMFQLCPISEKVTGITGRELARLSPAQQMPYMYRYFKAMGCDRDPPASKTMTQAYLCVFLPAYRKKPPEAKIWPRGVNPLHDVDNNDWIYKWEVDCNMTTSYAIGSKSCGFNLPTCSLSKVKGRPGMDY